MLDPLGHELVQCSSGEEALRQLLSGDFALILLDVQMPGLDGFKTAQLIKESAAHARRSPSSSSPRSAGTRPTSSAGTRTARSTTCSSPSIPTSCARRCRSSSSFSAEGEDQGAGGAAARTRARAAREEDRGAHPRARRRHAARACGPPARRARPTTATKSGRLLGPRRERAATSASARRTRRRRAGDARSIARPPRPAAARDRVPPAPRRATARTAGTCCRARPERDERGRVTGWIATATDIEEQKRGEEARARLLAAGEGGARPKPRRPTA